MKNAIDPVDEVPPQKTALAGHVAVI